MNDEADRWAAAKERYINLGLHPDVAGHLALSWMDGPAPESLTDAYERISEPSKTVRAQAVQLR